MSITTNLVQTLTFFSNIRNVQTSNDEADDPSLPSNSIFFDNTHPSQDNQPVDLTKNNIKPPPSYYEAVDNVYEQLAKQEKQEKEIRTLKENNSDLAGQIEKLKREKNQDKRNYMWTVKLCSSENPNN